MPPKTRATKLQNADDPSKKEPGNMICVQATAQATHDPLASSTKSSPGSGQHKGSRSSAPLTLSQPISHSLFAYRRAQQLLPSYASTNKRTQKYMPQKPNPSIPSPFWLKAHLCGLGARAHSQACVLSVVPLLLAKSDAYRGSAPARTCLTRLTLCSSCFEPCSLPPLLQRRRQRVPVQVKTTTRTKPKNEGEK